MLSVNGASVGDKNLGAEASLNPNAAEFVPSAMRPRVGSLTIPESSSKFTAAASPSRGKSVLDRSDSSISANSDEEAQQYWHHQLPDDITPDFNTMGVEDNREVNTLPFSNLSLSGVNEASRYNPSTSMLKGHNDKHPFSSHGEYPSPTSFQPSIAKPWEKQVVGNNQLLARERHSFNGNSSRRFLAEMDNADASHLEFLASQFPGVPAERLAELYLSSGGDLKLTIEMLHEVGGGFNQTPNSKYMSAANLRASNFPTQDGFPKPAGDHHHHNQNFSHYRSSLPVKNTTQLLRSSTMPSRNTIDYASAIRRLTSQDSSSIWKYERNGALAASIGTSRSPQVLASSYNRGNNLVSRGSGSAHAPPVWLDAGEAVANEYSGTMDEARDNARLRNAYIEQARQAYLAGNKALARELSITGHVHPTKTIPVKSQEPIYRQRNPDTLTNGRERMIDLHGLQVNEAIHVLKRELAVMRISARSSEQHILVFIRVGPARGLRTPAGLPTAVQRYLLEEEGLHYSEPQPGILRLVIY